MWFDEILDFTAVRRFSCFFLQESCTAVVRKMDETKSTSESNSKGQQGTEKRRIENTIIYASVQARKRARGGCIVETKERLRHQIVQESDKKRTVDTGRNGTRKMKNCYVLPCGIQCMRTIFYIVLLRTRYVVRLRLGGRLVNVLYQYEDQRSQAKINAVDGRKRTRSCNQNGFRMYFSLTTRARLPTYW